MPFKSKAQRRKFAALLVEGKIKPETFEEWNQESGGKELPERAGSKTKAATKKTATKKRSTNIAAPRKPARKKASRKAKKK